MSDPRRTVRSVNELSDQDRAILAFEARPWQHAGSKDAAIFETFGCSATRYYQRLSALLDSPAAYVADPMLVKRLRAQRTQRRARRLGG